MPRDLGELGEMFSSEEVRELRQGDHQEIKKLKADKKSLEDKIARLARLSQPLLEELSEEIPAGNNSPHWSMDIQLAINRL